MKTRPCVLCGKQMESIVGDWDTKQPSGGGEIQLIFAYGSREFDLAMEGTVFSGIVCDECSVPLVAKMERVEL